MDCIFCKIIDGEIPAVKVLDKDQVIAFMDINPASRGHMLIVPKKHVENIFEISEDDLSAVMNAVKRCAQAVRQALNRLSVSQWEMNEGNIDELQEIAREVKEHIPSGL